MVRSLIFFIAFATLGSAGVWFGIPRLQPILTGEDRIRTEALRELLNDVRQTLADRIAPEPQPAKVIDISPLTSSQRPDTAPIPSAPEGRPPVLPPDTPPPASPPVAPPKADAAPEWGVVVKDTACYDTRGKIVCEVPAATAVDIYRWRDTRSGAMAECTLHNGLIARDRRVLMLSKDLDAQPVPYSTVDPRARTMLIRYYELTAAIRKRERDLRKIAVTSNPHSATYKSALDRYNAFAVRAEELTVKRDAATGAARSRFGDELRRMIPQGKQLKNRYMAAKKSYDEWKERHPLNIDADPRLNELRRERSRLDKELQAQ